MSVDRRFYQEMANGKEKKSSSWALSLDELLDKV